MKHLFIWILLLYLPLSYADDLESMLNQVSEEAANTSLENTKPKVTEVPATNEPVKTEVTTDSIDEMTQAIAERLSEILGTNNHLGTEQLSLSLESVVNSALHNGKNMEQIRVAVNQAMQEITGQEIKLSPDISAIEKEMAKHAAQPTLYRNTNAALADPTSTTETDHGATTDTQEPLADTSSQSSNGERTTVVLEGESLFRVAQRVYGKENGRRFLDLLEANRDVIDDEHVVHKGLVLRVP